MTHHIPRLSRLRIDARFDQNGLDASDPGSQLLPRWLGAAVPVVAARGRAGV